MKEIEVKILNIDPEKVVAKLKELGAEKVESGLVKIKAYDFPGKKLREKGSFVRVRTFGHRTELVMKQLISNDTHKIMQEIQTNVEDFDATAALFEALEMEKYADYEKYRATYALGDIKIEFDLHPEIPWFIEVEAPTEELVNEGVEKLGFRKEDMRSEGSHILFKDFGDWKNTKFSQAPDYDRLFK